MKKDMETKQTAVDWLIEMLIDNKYLSKDSEHLFEHAKQMEKKQIINAFGVKRQFIGFDDNEFFGIKEVTGEEYYNETYGK